MAILVGDTLYFSANDGSSGYELWAHDTSNASTWRVAEFRSGTYSGNPGQHMAILVGDTLYFSADDGSSGHELWAHQPNEITSLGGGSGSGSSGGMTNITSATSCTTSPSLPNGLNIDSSTCTISGTPTDAASNATYTITAVISGTTFQTNIWVSSSTFGEITSAVEGAHLNLGEAMTPISLNYTSQTGTVTVANGSGNETRWTMAGATNGASFHVVEPCSAASYSSTLTPNQYFPTALEYGSCSGLVGDTIYFRGRADVSNLSLIHI